jgi:hypothetical protein
MANAVRQLDRWCWRGGGAEGDGDCNGVVGTPGVQGALADSAGTAARPREGLAVAGHQDDWLP